MQHDVDTSTSEPSAPLLREALDAHGGLDRWRQFNGVASTIVVGGDLWRIKGVEMDRAPRRTTSEFGRQWTRQTSFGNPDWTYVSCAFLVGVRRLRRTEVPDSSERLRSPPRRHAEP